MKLTAVLDFFGTDIAIECVLSALNDVGLLYSSLLLRLLLSCSDSVVLLVDGPDSKPARDAYSHRAGLTTNNAAAKRLVAS